ncbi:hypothetical protein GDO81_012646 [Engystomops pustulosus]|uniref:Uncharacterized protein n=1 Tax=Engystomops pustulosus TaxID=76066 RepID=A0AAV7AUQ7_ENGPU|nr:hypothetical protein GDO81_012646 [Engystomops pustulosus]
MHDAGGSRRGQFTRQLSYMRYLQDCGVSVWLGGHTAAVVSVCVVIVNVQPYCPHLSLINHGGFTCTGSAMDIAMLRTASLLQHPPVSRAPP